MHVLRLEEVLNTVQTYFDRQFSGKKFRCQAEVMQAKQHKNRVYIDLVEYDAEWSLTAKVKAIVREYELLAIYLQAHWLSSVNELCGKVIMFEASCWFHAQWWLSLHIQSLSHEFARGQLHVQQEQIRQTLREQWIYELNKEKTFGLPPVSLAIISSLSSEWLRDFLTIIDQSPRAISYELFGASIHGESAKYEVAEQLQSISEQLHRFSAVVITRGGWWWEWLVRQNDQRIAELICRLPVPVILATWHTSDRSVLDEIVRHAAKTPSDAAHLVVDGMEQMNYRLFRLWEDIEILWEKYKEFYRNKIDFWYTWIQTQWTLLRERVRERIEHRRGTIQLLGPEQQLARGYALVKSASQEYITKDTVWEIHVDDELYIYVYDKKIRVSVEEIT